MEYKIEELIPIVAELAGKYTGYESSSVTYEKAQMLMSGVIYCLNEYQNASENGLQENALSVKEQYRLGNQIVLKKADEVRKMYNELSAYFDDYHVKCLGDTMQREIPAFLQSYNAKYFPQDTILTFDYPLLCDMRSVHGVNAVHRYIHAIKTEQSFLKKFEKDYVAALLNRAIPNYTQMVDNVCEIVLLNTVGHMLLRKSFEKIGFDGEEYERLEKQLQTAPVEETERVLFIIVKKLTKQADGENREQEEYFNYAVKDMAVRIHTAARIKQLDKIFVI